METSGGPSPDMHPLSMHQGGELAGLRNVRLIVSK